MKTTRGKAQQDTFDRLRQMLAVHETAEEEVVHPAARLALEGGHDGLVDDRLAEENEAKKMLSELEGMSPGQPSFSTRLNELRMAVLAHARAEERYEFAHLRDKSDQSTLRAMATSVKAAEAFAPTHPHAGVESATANLAAGHSPRSSIGSRTRCGIPAACPTIHEADRHLSTERLLW